ncbi:DUF4198 domain-containing protein [Magnetospirillum sulfuroxidans]|uniref:DUF4198 domain-containing protein n=1 Tax=Magnetospirillum sulfuroxidans TaxID=611300 RepID=A0ABS5IFF4_9PROT|nr:DUF4198 domain-containing protein [Magnetospirillum sulfuroxidans]MBR9973150.1 DUF4198 domain-containing protein [Magnetospirillum sulfuroxidans]
MHRFPVAAAVWAGLTLAPVAALAHFQEIIPSADIVAEDGDHTLSLDLTFTHPMEQGPVMEMALPTRMGVVSPAGKEDLKAALVAVKKGEGKTAYTVSHKLKAPGDYVYYVEPAPYWEPGEGKQIIHYAKVVVDLGAGEGWDTLVGLPVEIEPLVRPYGLWTGNVFRGIVRHNGKIAPFAEIEVEWRNDGSVHAPSDPFVTQVIKADAQGQFTYGLPRAGWWGFAALIDGKPMKGPGGKMVPTELGGLLWVKAVDMK